MTSSEAKCGHKGCKHGNKFMDGHGTCGKLNHHMGCNCHLSDPAAKAIEKGRIFNHRDGMSELDNFYMKVKATEIVEWIKLGVCKHEPAIPRCNECMTQGIAEVLEAERKAKQEDLDEAFARGIQTGWKDRENGYAEGYRRGLEEAAMLFDTMDPTIADRIRQLKGER